MKLFIVQLNFRIFCGLFFVGYLFTGNSSAGDEEKLRSYLGKYCADCHDDDVQKGNFNIEKLPFELSSEKNYKAWVTVFDRIDSGEMPPKKKKPLPPETKEEIKFITALSLKAYDSKLTAEKGRSILRRLNRYEYENSLRDLLNAPWLEIKDKLPEDGESNRFNKSGGALQVSHVQMASYLGAANYALREVLARHLKKPKKKTVRFYAREQTGFQRFERSARGIFPMVGVKAEPEVFDKKKPVTVGEKDPVTREKEAFGVVASSYEPMELKFNQFNVEQTGYYKLRFKTWSFWAHPLNQKVWWKAGRKEFSKGRREEPVTIYGERVPRIMRKLGGFDAYPDSDVNEIEAYLLKGETVRVDAARLYRARFTGGSRTQNPLATKEGQPGVAFAWMEVIGPIFEEWPSVGHKLLFSDLPIKNIEGSIEVVSNNLQKDAQSLLRHFLDKAYRQPSEQKDVDQFMEIFHESIKQGNSFMDSMIICYSAVLCSPKFIYLQEEPGRLNNRALASRISFFLHNSAPDQTLLKAADEGRLGDATELKKLVDLLLDASKSERFVDSFLDYWLDLRYLNINSPDENLYPDYYLDDFLSESALNETRLFFHELIKSDLPASNVIHSDFAMLNGKLADHYDLPKVKGIELKKVKLPKGSVRGGLLTQASVLRVTANGTNTSPVVRGVWVMERIIGKVPPPPPPNIPVVEPDTRGAQTIREQLEKHRTSKSCNICHTKIDPAGFALENFDIYGGWRDKYRALSEGNDEKTELVNGFGKNGHPFAFYHAQPVDATGEVPGGEKFKDIIGFKELLLKDERQIARNLTNQLVTYATGAAPRFSDRELIEDILDRAKSSNYGIRTLIKEIVASKIFTNK